jgi:5-methylcytosine-specific restriction protein A
MAYATTEGRGRCARHALEGERGRQRGRKQRYEQSGRKLYGLSQWQALRAAHLAAHPFCAECERVGLPVMAEVVDHIIPHRGDRGRFFDSGNLQSLCKQCHDRKTAREDGGFGNRAQGPAEAPERLINSGRT